MCQLWISVKEGYVFSNAFFAIHGYLSRGDLVGFYFCYVGALLPVRVVCRWYASCCYYNIVENL